MKAVWKYPLFLGVNEVELPEGAKVLHVGEQIFEGKRTPTIWALVDTDASGDIRIFVVRGTGHQIGPDLEYIGTWQSPPYVWHLFEKIR